MSRVLQAVDSIHAVGIYCLALVPPNYLPKTPLGGIHLSETKRRFLEGTLHPANVLLCPHTCVTNLPKPREVHSGKRLHIHLWVLFPKTRCRLKLRTFDELHECQQVQRHIYTFFFFRCNITSFLFFAYYNLSEKPKKLIREIQSI